MTKLNNVSSEIIASAIAGDTEAFTEIYKNYYKRVYFVAVQYVKNEETAKDIVQDVFIKVHKQLKNLRSPEAFGSWLHVITYRECVSQGRRKMKIVNLKEEEQIEDFVDVNKADIRELVENERVKEIVMSSLNSMENSLKMIGILRFFEGLKVKEIAEILRLPKTTVGSRIDKIKRTLRKDLENQGVSIDNNYSLSIFSFAFLQETYMMLSERYAISEMTALEILKPIFTNRKAVTAGISILHKIILGGMLSATLATGIIVWNINTHIHENHLPVKHQEVIQNPIFTIEDAKIIEVQYNTCWTKEDILLHVKTTNNNYDKILVNGKETMRISCNGEYIIQVIKDSETIDERVVYIENIDKESPYGTGRKNEKEYILHVQDDVSGINPDSIMYYKNGQLCNDYIFDIASSNIIVPNDYNHSTHEFFISDNVGNTLNITIE